MEPLTKDQHVLEVEQEFSRCTTLISELTQKLPPFGPHRFANALQQEVQRLIDLFHEQVEASRDRPDEDTIATCTIYLHFINKLHENYVPYLETVPATLIPSRLLLSIISHATKLANKNGEEDFKDFVDIRFMPLWEANYGFFGLKDFPTGIDLPSRTPPAVQSRLNETKEHAPKWFVFLHYPRIHARNLLFYPLLFHETAHFWDITEQCSTTLTNNLIPTPTDLQLLFDERIKQFRREQKRQPNPEERERLFVNAYLAFNQLTSKWLGEIVCDLVATHHCGPAYFMAFMDFTKRVDAMQLDSDTHPGADLRLWFILKKLGRFRRRIYHHRFKQYLAGHSGKLRKPKQLKPNPLSPEDLTIYQIAYRTVLKRAQVIIDNTQRQLSIAEYNVDTFNKELPQLVDNLKRGYAASDFWSRTIDEPPNRPFAIPSILNACWITYLYQIKDFTSLFVRATPPGKIVENLTDIASQALEGAETLTYWREFTRSQSTRSSSKALVNPARFRKLASKNTQGILTKDFITKLLRQGELTVSPLLDPANQIELGSINLRLGTNIITTKRTERGMLTPAKLSAEDIAFFQEKVSYTFGHRFVLHPLELVLASTFEFIALPRDVSAFVITRSRYGRLGLVVATATYVHPNWRGCLTLELVNYGTVPIELECGAAVAQLILFTAKPIKRPELIQKIPVEPEFSTTSHPDWRVLRRFRDLYGLTGRADTQAE